MEQALKESEEEFKSHFVFKLREAALTDAYHLAGREPKQVKLERLREILRPLADHPWDWVRRFWQGAEEKLAMRQSSGLALDDPDGYADLVRVLQALPELEETGRPKRLFSQELFHDSKHFERHVQKRLVSLLRTYGEQEMETEEGYLDSVGLVENPRHVWLSGALVLEIGGQRVETEGFAGGVGLSAVSIREMKVGSSNTGCGWNRKALLQFLKMYEHKAKKGG